MANRYLMVDDSTGKRSLGSTPTGVQPYSTVVKIGNSTTTTIAVSQTFTTGSMIWVFVGGIKRYETDDWTRNVGANTISLVIGVSYMVVEVIVFA